jgi:branched-subunit amino acid ABC-type transport system permease component
VFEFGILFPSVLNGLTTGAVYALIALGLTLIYGVLHIINFAHGAALMVALYAVFLLKTRSATRCSAASSTAPATARTRTSCSSRSACRSCSRTWR